MKKSDLITLRDWDKAQDHNFVLATWLKGLFFGSRYFSLIDRKSFFENYHRAVEFILSHPGVRVRVAVLKDDPSVIIGYSVTSQNDTILHWVHCKGAWRRIGIAKSLVPTTVQTVTHLTDVGISVLRKHRGIRFDPFII